MTTSDPTQVRIRLHGENVSAETAKEAVEHFRTLLREVTRATCGNPDAVDWKVTNLRIVCDGCDRDRPEIHDDWIYREGDDLCPECQ